MGPPPLPPPSPLLPLERVQSSLLPLEGVQVLHGRTGATLTCLRRNVDEDTRTAKIKPGAKDVMNIAAQCCLREPQVADRGESKCRRYLGADPAGCIAGKPPVAMTYAEAVALCASKLDSDGRALTLCNVSCAYSGCDYNRYP